MSFGSKTLFIERVIFSSFLSLVLKMLVRDSDKLNIEWKSFNLRFWWVWSQRLPKAYITQGEQTLCPFGTENLKDPRLFKQPWARKKKKNLSIDHKRGDQVLQQIIGADLVW